MNENPNQLSRKAREDEQKLLDMLVKNYNSQEKARERIDFFFSLLKFFYMKKRIGFNEGKISQTSQISMKRNPPIISFGDLKKLLEKDLKKLFMKVTLYDVISRALEVQSPFDIDIKFKNCVWRLFPLGAPPGTRSIVFAVFMNDGDKFVVHLPPNKHSWDHLTRYLGGQAEINRGETFVINKYCGINLHALEQSHSFSADISYALIDIYKTFKTVDKEINLSNIVYDTKSKMLTVIDRY